MRRKVEERRMIGKRGARGACGGERAEQRKKRVMGLWEEDR